MGSVDPLRITVDEERQAVALAQELIGVSDVDLHPEGDRWVVSLGAGHIGNRVVVRVLDAVRRSLAGKPTASALVTLDGREYQMRAIDHDRPGVGTGQIVADAAGVKRRSGDIALEHAQLLPQEQDLDLVPRSRAAEVCRGPVAGAPGRGVHS
jgi:hypothetical protein